MSAAAVEVIERDVARLSNSGTHRLGSSRSMGGGVQIGVYVSMLNRCDYCVEHHFAGLRRLLDDDDRGDAIRASLENDQPDAFDPRQFAMLAYARRLTLEPSEVTPDDLHRLRAAGLDDGEILEVNQVAAYFAYANRTVQGLGVTTDGEVLGLSPADSDASEWHHG